MKSAAATTAKVRNRREPWNAVDFTALLAFLIWSAAGLWFIDNHVTAATIPKWQLPDGLRRFIQWCLENGDPVLIFLAFANTHLHAARQWTAGAARRWAAIVLVAAYAIEALGTKTGIPFGDYRYTGSFGYMIWVVPLTIPLAWHVVVTNALFLIRAVAPHASRVTEAVLVGVICTTYDFILEPFATTVKHYWIWTERTIPPINYVSWFVISGLLVWLFAPTISTRYRLDPRPVLVLALTVAIFIAGELR